MKPQILDLIIHLSLRIACEFCLSLRILSYPREIPPKKARLAMKIGGTYWLSHIGKAAWEKAASEWRLDCNEVMGRVTEISGAIPEGVGELGTNDEGDIVRRLGDKLTERASSIAKEFKC